MGHDAPGHTSREGMAEKPHGLSWVNDGLLTSIWELGEEGGGSVDLDGRREPEREDEDLRWAPLGRAIGGGFCRWARWLGVAKSSLEPANDGA
ncbi:hypothetical protein CRG98_025854 [Punica granatum]|uniref:Uncharacterized protein n=1 Tax=Punica granatum TaxID=22663 RepID=A0A2I0JBW9_PUNGR|nr:hypothetical protein CRG98_025854 [Punica granatum]